MIIKTYFSEIFSWFNKEACSWQKIPHSSCSKNASSEVASVVADSEQSASNTSTRRLNEASIATTTTTTSTTTSTSTSTNTSTTTSTATSTATSTTASTAIPTTIPSTITKVDLTAMPLQSTTRNNGDNHNLANSSTESIKIRNSKRNVFILIFRLQVNRFFKFSF